MKKQNLSPSQLFVSGGICFLFISGAFAAPDKIKPEIPEKYFAWVLFSATVSLAIINYAAIHYIPPRITVPIGICGWISMLIALIVIA
jgi:hypothetical protein